VPRARKKESISKGRGRTRRLRKKLSMTRLLRTERQPPAFEKL
jgi:hypothetical protein